MPKLQALPGMERQSIKEIDDAAESYVDARDKRMKHTEKEVAAKQLLQTIMAKHNVLVYRTGTTPPLVVEVRPGKPDVKVKEAGDNEASGDDKGDGEDAGE